LFRTTKAAFVRIHAKEDYIVRSFSDGGYYAVLKKAAAIFTPEQAANHANSTSVVAALEFLNDNKLPPNWDDPNFGLCYSIKSKMQQDVANKEKALATPTMKNMSADDKRGRSGSKKTPQKKDVPIKIGDMLKVYDKEKKSTYEAKVTGISKHNGPLFNVHYTGWNKR
jgi:hypothetical protein